MTSASSECGSPTPDSPGREPDLAGRSFTIVGINYAPEPTGIGPYTTFMANTLLHAGARVEVVTGVPHYPGWSVDRRYRHGVRWVEWQDGVKVVRLRHHVPSQARLSGRALMEASFAATAAQEVLRSRSDAVIAVTPSLAGLAAAVVGRRKRPLGAIVQDLTGEGASQSGTTGIGAGTKIAVAEYRMLRVADFIGVIAEGFTDSLAAGGISRTKLLHTPNFSRLRYNDTSIQAARELLGWEQGRLTVVHSGNMGMKQGLDVVLEAARLRPDIRWILVGKGNQRARLESMAVHVPNVEVHDPYSDDLYPSVLAAADALLVSEREGVGSMSLPSKLTAYVAAQRPIVAAVDAGGLTGNEIRRSGVGQLVPPSDPSSLVRGVLSSGEADATERQRAYHSSVSPCRAGDAYVHFAACLLAGHPRGAATV